MIISLDTETTGKDLYHGSRPYLVTVCKADGEQMWWEWDVDPLTRAVTPPPEDLEEITGLVEAAELVVMQNGKFDVTALGTLIPGLVWPWGKTVDTLMAGHLLASSLPHDLTSMALQYLGLDIQPYEDRQREVCHAARRLARRLRKDWALAKEGRPDMPSAGGGGKRKERGAEDESDWKADGWLPRQLVESGCTDDRYSMDLWRTVTRDYANADSAATLALWSEMRGELARRGLMNIYEERMRLLPVVHRMERRGLTLHRPRVEQLEAEYAAESVRCGAVCVNIAADHDHDLTLPANGVNGSLRTFMLGVLGLEPLQNPKAKTADPTLNKGAMDHYLATLDCRGKPYAFVKNLLAKRSRDTALAYLAGYRRYWLPLLDEQAGYVPGWQILYPNLNPTGTDTLRCSSSNPNEQNISKKEDFNLRYPYGPRPGYEWWSMDAKGIEDRLPAYESKEQDLIDIFERADEPPYYGSNHLLRFHTVYPDVWEKHLDDIWKDKNFLKKTYGSTYYQWVKNGGFAVQYGAVDRPGGWGTADRAFHKQGAHSLLRQRFSKLEALNQHWIRYAEKHGYVETIPDRSVDPTRGYPIMCTRTEWGRILPTVPLNYHIQSSAMWWTCRGMVRCQEGLDCWRRKDGYDGHIVMQVHDEIVFELPRRADPRVNLKRSNLPRARELARLMTLCGDDYGIPTPVGIEYHPESLSEGISF